MTKSMRKSTLESLGLGTVLEIFKNNRMPVNTSELVEQVFGHRMIGDHLLSLELTE